MTVKDSTTGIGFTREGADRERSDLVLYLGPWQLRWFSRPRYYLIFE